MGLKAQLILIPLLQVPSPGEAVRRMRKAFSAAAGLHEAA